MTASTQFDIDSTRAAKRRGWRWLTPLAGVVALIGSVPLLIGAVGLCRDTATPPKIFALVSLERNVPRVIDDRPFRESAVDFAQLCRAVAITMRSDPTLMGAIKQEVVRKLGLTDKADPVAFLRAGLDVEMLPDTSIFRISFRSADPVESATVANAVAIQFVEDFSEATRRVRAGRGSAIEVPSAAASFATRSIPGADMPFSRRVM